MILKMESVLHKINTRKMFYTYTHICILIFPFAGFGHYISWFLFAFPFVFWNQCFISMYWALWN